MDELCDRLASALKITDVKRLNDIKALLYADDVALIAHSRTELQKMVNVVAKFAEDYRLEVNLKPGKTEIMPVYTSSKAKRPSIRERGEIQARYRLMCWNQLVGAKLKYAFDVWRAPLQRALEGDEEAEPVLSAEEMICVFSNVRTLHGLNKKLMLDLESRIEGVNGEGKGWTGGTKLGEVFLTLGPFLKLYTDYVSNHEKAVYLLSRLNRQSRWQTFLAKADPAAKASNAGAGTNGVSHQLASYLISPVQRIPRYRLLLQELVKNTDAGHPDSEPLAQALSLVGEVATHINEAMRAQENQVKIRAIEEQFLTSPGFLAPGRFYIKQGQLSKICRSKDEVYTFFLFNDMIAYCSEWLGRLRLHRKINLDASFSLTADPPTLFDSNASENGESFPAILEQRERCFQLCSAKKSFLVYAASKSDRDGWVQAIEEQLRLQQSKALTRSRVANNNSNISGNSSPDSSLSTAATEAGPEKERSSNLSSVASFKGKRGSKKTTGIAGNTEKNEGEEGEVYE
eukprot:g9657.t1